MTKTKFTPWFPGNIAPVHPGVYPRSFFGVSGYAKWCGKYWFTAQTTRDRAEINTLPSFYQLSDARCKWRGFTTPQKVTK